MSHKIKLKVAAKKKWLEALRSGAFEQGQGDLRTWSANRTFSHCCLGVANEVLGLNNEWGSGSLRFANFASMCLKKTLPSDSQKAYDAVSLIQGKLTRMNDFQNKSFNQIASWIEKNL